MKQKTVGNILVGRIRRLRVASAILFLLAAFTTSVPAQKPVSQQDALAILQR